MGLTVDEIAWIAHTNISREEGRKGREGNFGETQGKGELEGGMFKGGCGVWENDRHLLQI
jgi:hypothetical protein